MPNVNFTNDQKAQLVGWLNRENDYMMSIKAMAERVVVPGATGTIELIRNDFDWVRRVRDAIRGERDKEVVDLSAADLETLVDVARANHYANRVEFWQSVIDSVNKSAEAPSIDHHDPNPTPVLE